jgi:hypothetical protein
MKRRRLIAAGLWALLAFLIWNVKFDLGVRQAATRYLVARGLYLQDRGARVEMAPHMRAGVAAAARAATVVALPAAGVAVWLASGRRGRYARAASGTYSR